jgi:hypothetical protein
VTNSKPVVVAKLAANTKVTEKVKPVVLSKPAATVKPAANSNNTKPQAAKQPTINKPVVIEPAKTKVTPPAPKERASSFQLPAGYEKINLTNSQREKAAAIMDKYAGQIRNLESQLNATKASREKELSALLTPQPQAPLAKSKEKSQPKPTTNAGPARSAGKTGAAKSQAIKVNPGKRDNTMASTAPISKDKSAKKAPGKK